MKKCECFLEIRSIANQFFPNRKLVELYIPCNVLLVKLEKQNGRIISNETSGAETRVPNLFFGLHLICSPEKSLGRGSHPPMLKIGQNWGKIANYPPNAQQRFAPLN